MSSMEEAGVDRPERSGGLHEAVRLVGIGASAGGLEALEQFFDHVSPTAGAAYVVVQHLSPNYKSLMNELLARHTKMKIRIAEEGMRLVANEIYLIPPQQYLRVKDGYLRLVDYEKREGVHLPIDVFFHSLAEEQGAEAIAIILSGTGTDGTRGVRAIHEAGGLVMVQNEDSAKFAGMPKSAIATGYVRIIHAPDLLASQVNAVLNGEALPEREGVVRSSLVEMSEEENLKQIFLLIKQQCGIDFSGYKHAGVMRRIERRINLNQLDSLDDYLRMLLENSGEVTALQKDLLIGVTHFFRDAEAFAVIYQSVIPKIIENKRKDVEQEIRIWVAGCSTGEEAYTFAMLFKEYCSTHNLLYNIRIFATDLDEESILYASQGIYPLALENDVPRPYVEKYFVRKGDAYQVHKDIRKMVVFAPHNIAKDPPFIHLDLVSCRNLMIYFNADTQRKVLSLFHFALLQNGFLFLGPSESIGKMTELFQPFNKKWNIFQMCEPLQVQAITSALEMPRDVGEQPASTRVLSADASSLVNGQTMRKLDEVYTTLIDEYMPPSVIVDRHDDIVHTYGDLSKYIALPRGKMSPNLYKMLSTQLAVVVRTGIHKVRKEKQRVLYKDIKLAGEAEPTYINVSIRPFSDQKINDFIIILFEQMERRIETGETIVPIDMESIAALRLLDLERELQYTKENLQATIEELETSYEELQSTNEELIASNEELQSTNEELQSVNEELFSVNAEYQRKIEQLTELNNDMDNFLISTKIGTIFLDRDLCIRRYTPAVTQIINLLEVDIGRPINHISNRLKYDQLYADAQEVLNTTRPIEREVKSFDECWYNVRILPYRTVENFIKGVVVTFVDITELKMVNKELLKLSHAIHQSPSSILITDADGLIEYANPTFSEKSGYPVLAVMGRHLTELYDEPHVRVALATGEKWAGQLKNLRHDGQVYWENASLLPIRNEANEIIHFLQTSEDITVQKKTEELLRKSEMLSAVGQLAAGIAHEIRNPLTALKGFLQLINAAGEKNETYIKIMNGEFERIEQIINELLLLSKPHALSYQHKDMLVILNDVLMLLEAQAHMKQITFATEIDPDLPLVECVENQIKQVFINILKNGMEAMPSGGQITISVLKQTADMILVRFVDTGVGIPPEQLQRLGQPFFTTKEKGTGLGMMVTHKIIEDHNGRLEIRSTVGLGTTVEILLPAVR